MIRWLVVGLVACGSPEPDKPPPPAPVTTPARPACDPKQRTTCVGDAVVECSKGELGRTVSACQGACKAGACVDPCAIKDVELIYVVDNAGKLLRFDPRKQHEDPFQLVGKLACESDRPFSMAVARDGIAWILFDTGKLHRVSILDAHCAPGGWLPEPNPARMFGMGFVSPKGLAVDSLYVAAADETHMLAQLDVTTEPPRWTSIGPIAETGKNNAELSGTSAGELFGYFPEAGGFVQQIDRTTGKVIGKRWRIPATGKVEADAYAFAHWGGVFYVFVTVNGNSAVHAIHRKTGKYELLREHLPLPIVGAGVSTCAPQLEQ
ncbi:MAG: hypothetical protein ABI867_39395 [Kofleriaceae bacterium]